MYLFVNKLHISTVYIGIEDIQTDFRSRLLIIGILIFFPMSPVDYFVLGPLGTSGPGPLAALETMRFG
jgi:hypothetical protein